MLDIIIRNGSIVDGSGRPRFRADLGVKDGKIALIGDLSESQAGEVIDAAGLAVSPGFIDMHSHSDLSLMAHRRSDSSLAQGITTEVIGSCGWSMAPVKEETRRSVLRGLISGLVHKEAYESLDWTWNSFGQFLEALEKGGIGTNVAPQVGQSLVRAHVVGTEKREAAPGEIQAMKALVRQAMEDGAFGLSTGRSYRPGGFAPTQEIVELAKVVAEYDGVYATHMKDEGDGLFDSVQEVISIAQETGLKAEISHHKAIGRKNFGKVHRSLEMIEGARRKGLRITVDVYPYEFAQASALVRMLPVEAWQRLQGGSRDDRRDAFPTSEEISELLKDRALVSKIKELPEVVSASERIGNYLIVKCPSSPELQGRLLQDVADERSTGVADLAAGLIAENGLDVWSAWPISMDDVHTVISAGFAMGGTDAFTLDRPISPTPIHPRHYGTFPRIVGRFVNMDKLFSLEEAVRKCTHNPATVMGIPQRGLIEVGYWADLVVFDPENVMDTATGTDPYSRPEGIRYVLVNGKVSLAEGAVRPVFAGRVLRRR